MGQRSSLATIDLSCFRSSCNPIPGNKYWSVSGLCQSGTTSTLREYTLQLFDSIGQFIEAMMYFGSLEGDSRSIWSLLFYSLLSFRLLSSDSEMP